MNTSLSVEFGPASFFDSLDIIRCQWTSAYVPLSELERYAAYSPGSLAKGSKLTLLQDVSPRHRAGDTVHLMDDAGEGKIRVHHPKSRKTMEIPTSHAGIARRELALSSGRDLTSPTVQESMRPGGGGKQKWLEDAASKAVAVKSRSPHLQGQAWVMHGGRLHPITAHEAGRVRQPGEAGRQHWSNVLSKIWDEHAKHHAVRNKLLQSAKVKHKGVGLEEYLKDADQSRIFREHGKVKIAHRGLAYALENHEHDKGTPVVSPQEILSRVWHRHWSPSGSQSKQLQPTAAPARSEPQAAKAASVPIMITGQMRAGLKQLGYADEHIKKMKPAEAHDLINRKVKFTPPRAGPSQPSPSGGETFVTSDGYKLQRKGNEWTDGDMVFKSNRRGRPIDSKGAVVPGRLIAPATTGPRAARKEQSPQPSAPPKKSILNQKAIAQLKQMGYDDSFINKIAHPDEAETIVEGRIPPPKPQQSQPQPAQQAPQTPQQPQIPPPSSPNAFKVVPKGDRWVGYNHGGSVQYFDTKEQADAFVNHSRQVYEMAQKSKAEMMGNSPQAATQPQQAPAPQMPQNKPQQPAASVATTPRSRPTTSSSPPPAGPSAAAAARPPSTHEQLRDLGWPDYKIRSMNATRAANLIKNKVSFSELPPGGQQKTAVQLGLVSPPTAAAQKRKHYEAIRLPAAAPAPSFVEDSDYDNLYAEAKAYQGIPRVQDDPRLTRAVYLVRTNQVKGPESLKNRMTRDEQRQYRVLFEVAPNPDDTHLTKQWNELEPSVRHHVSREVANHVVPQVLKATGVRARMVDQYGGYLEHTNPSFAILASHEIDIDRVMQATKMTGFVLSQQSMMVVRPDAFEGGQKVGVVTIHLPRNMSMDQVDAVYQHLRQADSRIQGHTTVDGQMMILDFGDETADIANKIDQALGGRYEMRVGTAHAAMPEEKEYGYADQTGTADVAGARAHAHRLRSEATAIVHRWLGEQGPGTPEPERSGSDAGVGAGDLGGGSVPASGPRFIARHYAKLGRGIEPVLDPKYHGTGIRGAERLRRESHGDKYLPRLYFYAGEDTSGIHPEAGLDPNKYHEFEVPHGKLLHYGTPPYEGFGDDVKQYAKSIGLDPSVPAELQTAVEHWAHANGYWGVYHPKHQIGATFHPIDTSKRTIDHPDPRPGRPAAASPGPISEQSINRLKQSFREYAEPVIKQMQQAGQEAGIPAEHTAALAPLTAQALKIAHEQGMPAFSMSAVDKPEVAGNLPQVEDILTGKIPIDKFVADAGLENYGEQRGNILEKVMNFFVQFGKKKDNRVVNPRLVINKPAGRAKATQAIKEHTLREIHAWKQLTGGNYKSFYGKDITGTFGTNNRLRIWAKKRYGQPLQDHELQFIHMLAALGSGGATPKADMQYGMKVFDEYKRTGRATGYTDPHPQVHKKTLPNGERVSGKDPKPVFFDSKTGDWTFEAAGNKPVLKSAWGQASKAYNVSGLRQFNKLLDHFGGNLERTMDWLGTKHDWQEIRNVFGKEQVYAKALGKRESAEENQPVFIDSATGKKTFKSEGNQPLMMWTADKLKQHEYLNPDGQTYGIFTIGGTPKHGSYVLNRWQKFGTITKDMWVARTMSRYFGEDEIHDAPWDPTTTGTSKDPRNRWGLVKRQILDDAWTQAGKELGVSPAEVQEIMWDAEKRLYEMLGAQDDTAYTSEGVFPGRKKVRELDDLRVAGDAPSGAVDIRTRGGSDTLAQRGARAKVKATYNPTTHAINLAKNGADISSMIHESHGHWFQHVLDKHPEFGPTIRQHYGNFDPVNNKQGLEKFARHVEWYMRTGKAPVQALAKVFEAIRQWMLSIYRKFRHGAMPQEIRAIFDRVYADAGDPYVKELIDSFVGGANARREGSRNAS